MNWRNTHIHCTPAHTHTLETVQAAKKKKKSAVEIRVSGTKYHFHQKRSDRCLDEHPTYFEPVTTVEH